jgi:hypothetical protein
MLGIELDEAERCALQDRARYDKHPIKYWNPSNKDTGMCGSGWGPRPKKSTVYGTPVPR